MTDHESKNAIQPAAGALVLAFSAAALLNAVLTIAKEVIDPLKSAMASLGGHHWPAHVAIVAAVFFVGAIALPRTPFPARWVKTNTAAMRLLVGSTLVAAVLIAGFYVATE
ncbi:hypothetical protein KQI84_13575 [bacterium]|nr:hypothetical protein [bacterium]